MNSLPNRETDFFSGCASAPAGPELEVDIEMAARVGLDGATVAGASVDAAGNLMIEMSDGRMIRAGRVNGRSFAGKRIVLYGDSISSDYGIAPGTYAGLIRKKFGTDDAVAWGQPGKMLGSPAGDRSDSLTDDQRIGYIASLEPDLLILQGGTGDYWGAVPLGGCYGDIESADYVKTATGGLRYLLHHLAKNLPAHARILFVTPPPGTYGGRADTEPNAAGHRMDEYVHRLRAVCAEYHVPVCDAWALSGWSTYHENTAPKYTVDGVHLSPEGYDRLTDLLLVEASMHC